MSYPTGRDIARELTAVEERLERTLKSVRSEREHRQTDPDTFKLSYLDEIHRLHDKVRDAEMLAAGLVYG